MTPMRSVRSMVAVLAMVGSACSSNSSPSAGSGGANGGAPSQGGMGGRTGAGGIPGTGGTSQSGTGGASAAGGRVGTGGAGTGGRTGAGGATVGSGGVSSGGSSSSGGSAAGGTTSGTGTAGSTAAGGVQSRDGGLGTGGTGGGPAIDAGGGLGAAVPSAGCGKAPTLKNSPGTANQNTLTINGKSRQFIMRWPDNYDNSHPYRLIIGLHGATGKDTDIGPSYFGLWDLSKGSTIFIAPSADGGLWDATNDTAFVTEILKAVKADLCIDTTRIMLEGFSQGAAMSWTLACGLKGEFRAAVGHSGGGVTPPKTCDPVAYFGSGGLQENVTQTTQSDQFAKWDGCTIETFAKPPTGGHTCNDYKGCSAGHPVRWCPYDGPHTPSPNDSGKSTSWMPSEVWPFMSQF